MMDDETSNIISEGIDKVYLDTLKSVVDWLKKYDVKVVITALENEIKIREAAKKP